MNATQQVDATLARAESALVSHDVSELALAEQSLIGCLDWAAKQTGDEVLVRAVLATVAGELRSLSRDPNSVADALDGSEDDSDNPLRSPALRAPQAKLFVGFHGESASARKAAAWTHRVVKRAHGTNGKWFDFPTAKTFASESAARAYAEDFARSQAGVCGVAIDVRLRSGSCGYGRGALVATYKP